MLSFFYQSQFMLATQLTVLRGPTREHFNEVLGKHNTRYLVATVGCLVTVYTPYVPRAHIDTAKLNQHKHILTSKFGSKDMLLWKRGYAIIFTDDEKLWIPYRQI